MYLSKCEYTIFAQLYDIEYNMVSLTMSIHDMITLFITTNTNCPVTH